MCLKAENKTKEQLKKPKLEIMIAYCPLPCETILKHIFFLKKIMTLANIT